MSTLTLVEHSKILAGDTSNYSDPIASANDIYLMLSVTNAPRAATPVRVYAQCSLDGQSWGRGEVFVQFVEIADADLYFAHSKVHSPYIRFAISPLDFCLTAGLSTAAQ